MNRFRTVFSNRHVVLPVIHVVNTQQAIRNATVAREAGADGVFLINHDILPCSLLMEVYTAVSVAHPDWWIGINCLDLEPIEVFKRAGRRVDGIWVDNGMIDETKQTQPKADDILATQKEIGWQGLYFGGVAFKYQAQVRDVAQAASVAANYMDVVTTSGPATGQAAAPDKIRQMKHALDKQLAPASDRFQSAAWRPLAIASGITPENVPDYLPIADCFLVATGISKSFDELDPHRTGLLIESIRKGR